MKLQVKKMHPFLQAAAILAITLPAIFIISASGTGKEVIWQLTATGILLFAAANPILGIFNKNWSRYLLFSLCAFGIMAGILFGITNFMASQKFSELGNIQMIFLSVIVFYLIFNFLVLIFRSIVSLLGNME